MVSPKHCGAWLAPLLATRADVRRCFRIPAIHERAPGALDQHDRLRML
jgi:hypothetical protein